MKMRWIHGLIVCFFTTCIFACSLSLIFMNETYDFSFYLILFFIYGGLPILFMGLPFSLWIDKLFDRIRVKSLNKLAGFILHIIVYALAGFIGTWIYFFVLAGGKFEDYMIQDTFVFSLFGIYAALLFLIVRFILDVIIVKIKSRREKET